MEVKIKSNEGMVDATIEMVDGVMVVSPKDIKMRKIDLTQFRDGDILYCSWSYKQTEWVAILKGEVDYMDNTHVFMEDYCSLFLTGDNALEVEGFSDSATFVRHATEEEKQKLFKALADNGLEWDAEKEQLVKLKWKPKYKEFYFRIIFEHAVIIPYRTYWTDDRIDKAYYQKGWVFKTEEECQEFCDKLNQAISQVKP